MLQVKEGSSSAPLPTDIADHVGHDDQEWFANTHTAHPNQTPGLSGEGKPGSKVLYRS